MRILHHFEILRFKLILHQINFFSCKKTKLHGDFVIIFQINFMTFQVIDLDLNHLLSTEKNLQSIEAVIAKAKGICRCHQFYHRFFRVRHQHLSTVTIIVLLCFIILFFCVIYYLLLQSIRWSYLLLNNCIFILFQVSLILVHLFNFII